MINEIKLENSERVGQPLVNAFPLPERMDSFSGVQRAGRISMNRSMAMPVRGGMRGFNLEKGTAYASGQWFTHQARVVVGFRTGGYSPF